VLSLPPSTSGIACQGDVPQLPGACFRSTAGLEAGVQLLSSTLTCFSTSSLTLPCSQFAQQFACMQTAHISALPTEQVRNSVEVAVAEKPAAVVEEAAFNFAAYMKERATLVNEALDKSVPLQYPEIINESMR
jgi:hypothetical protein